MTDPFADPQPLIKRVYAYVAYCIGEGADAEDVTGAALERAFRYRASFDEARGDGISWVIGIAQRCIADRMLSVAFNDHDAQPSESHESRSLERIELTRAVRALSERDREIIALRFGADMTLRQIAGVLGVRINTVEVALHRALARLRHDLGETDFAAPSGLATPSPHGS